MKKSKSPEEVREERIRIAFDVITNIAIRILKEDKKIKSNTGQRRQV